MAGKSAKAPNKHIPMDNKINKPKKLTGTKTENNNTANPMITENALKIIPFPESRKVVSIDVC